MFNIITKKTVPCTSCGYRMIVPESLRHIITGKTSHDFKCNGCGAIIEYNIGFLRNVLSGEAKI